AATQGIYVVDTTVPVISSLPGPTTSECTNAPSFTTPTAADACDPRRPLSIAVASAPGSCPQNHDVTRTWTATDHCNNASTASQEIGRAPCRERVLKFVGGEDE